MELTEATQEEMTRQIKMHLLTEASGFLDVPLELPLDSTGRQKQRQLRQSSRLRPLLLQLLASPAGPGPYVSFIVSSEGYSLCNISVL